MSHPTTPGATGPATTSTTSSTPAEPAAGTTGPAEATGTGAPGAGDATASAPAAPSGSAGAPPAEGATSVVPPIVTDADGTQSVSVERTAAAEQAAPEQPAPQKVEDLPEWAQKEIRDARKEAGDNRVRAKDAGKQLADLNGKYEQMLQGVATALGLPGAEGDGGKSEPPDPEQLTAELAARDTELTTTRASLRTTQVQYAAFRAAADHDADAVALTDSKTFLDSVAELDPADQKFDSKLGDAIDKAVAANPKLRASQAPAQATSSGGEFAGGPGGRTDAESMSVDEHRAALKRRRRGATA